MFVVKDRPLRSAIFIHIDFLFDFFAILIFFNNFLLFSSVINLVFNFFAELITDTTSIIIIDFTQRSIRSGKSHISATHNLMTTAHTCNRSSKKNDRRSIQLSKLPSSFGINFSKFMLMLLNVNFTVSDEIVVVEFFFQLYNFLFLRSNFIFDFQCRNNCHRNCTNSTSNCSSEQQFRAMLLTPKFCFSKINFNRIKHFHY